MRYVLLAGDCEVGLGKEVIAVLGLLVAGVADGGVEAVALAVGRVEGGVNPLPVAQARRELITCHRFSGRQLGAH